MSNRRRPIGILVALALAAAALETHAQQRMLPLPADELSAEQAQALANFSVARGEPGGPWAALLRSPALMTRMQGLGDYLDFEGILPGWLREFVVLMTVREWGATDEWNAHYALAVDEGVSPEMARAIAEGRRPDGMVDEEKILYDFCTELHHNHGVSDATYERAIDRFGEQGVVETVSLIGYYTSLAMLANVTRGGNLARSGDDAGSR